MNRTDVIFVRIYLTEGEGRLADLLARLHDIEQVKGVTVFRGISGFGDSGEIHTSTLLDISLDLPLVVEFFDSAEKINAILSHLHSDFEPGHIVSWPATLVV